MMKYLKESSDIHVDNLDYNLYKSSFPKGKRLGLIFIPFE